MSRSSERNEVPFDEYDLFRRYWKCRNFELQNLWQRSIFLATFLVLCFTGYGFFFVHAFFDGSKVILFDMTVNLVPAHIIAASIALTGIVMSALWTCMAKGSKAWYEVYEHSIKVLEKQPGFTRSSFLREHGIGCFEQEKMPGYWDENPNEKKQFDSSVFSLKGGVFSPSKINIIIGPICFLIFCVLFLLHVFACFVGGVIAFVVSVLLGVLVAIFSLKNLSLRSSVLENKDPAGKIKKHEICELKGDDK